MNDTGTNLLIIIWACIIGAILLLYFALFAFRKPPEDK